MIEALLRWGAIALVAVVGPAVALTRDPRAQAMTLTLYGLALTMMFLMFQAPDVALAQATVGAVALPLMVVLTLARMRRIDRERDDDDKRDDDKRDEEAP